MGPNEMLERLLATAERIQKRMREQSPPYGPWTRSEETAALEDAEDAEDMAALFKSLHEHVLKTGQLPAAWATAVRDRSGS